MFRRVRLALILLLCSTGTALASGPSASITQVWIRTAPAGVMYLSGFMTLKNLTDKALQITAITSPGFGSVVISPASEPGQLHSTRLMKTFTLQPHQTVTFKPGGLHLKLLQPNKRLFEGDLVTLNFSFSDGSELTLLAPVRRLAPGS